MWRPHLNSLKDTFIKTTLLFGMVALLFGASGTFALAQGTDDDETRAPNWAEELVYEVVVSGIGTLFTAAGSAFDNSIEWFIVRYATIYTENFGGAIELVWEVIRDMINIALIFGLIYVGFRFILNADDSGAKRNLVTLIIAALLVNFSLFFAKALVDISNILSVSFADAISSGSLGVSESFAGTLNMGPAFNADQSMTEALGGERTSYWGYIFQLLIIILVAAFVFFAAAILIMIRFIVISFMLIFSPVIVLGWIFPFFSGLSRKWLNTFLGQAFMAPALLLNFYASFLVLLGLQSVSDSGLGSQATSPGSIDALPFFILGMGFLIASLIVAQKMGAAGASTAISIGHASRRKAGQLAKGGVRNIGRGAAAAGAVGMQQTRGRRAYRTLKSQKFKDKLENMDRNKARKAYQKQKARAESGYDVRNLGKYIKEKSVLQTQNKGFQKKMEDREKLESELFKAMGTVDTSKVTLSENTRSAYNQVSAKQHELDNAKQDLEQVIAPRRARIKQLTTALDTATEEEKETIRKELEDQRKAISDTQAASNVDSLEKELAQHHDTYKKSLENDKIRTKYRRQITSLRNNSNKYGVRAVPGQDDVFERGVRTWDGKQSVEGRMNRVLQPHVTADERDLNEKMLKEYGRSGQEKEKKKKKEDDLKILSEQLKDDSNPGNTNNNQNA